MAGINDNLIPAKKGEIRNPKGYPKGVPHSRTRLKRLMSITEDLKNPITGVVEGFTVAEQLDLAQIIKARKGDTKAYQVILDRLEGKPEQSIDIGQTGDNPIRILLDAYGVKEGEYNDGKNDAAVSGPSDSTT